MTRRDDKAKAAIERNKAANKKAADADQAAKEALQEKMSQKGGAGKLSRKELNLAKRMGDGEGQKKK